MIIIIIQTIDGKKYNQFWNPVKLKYADRQNIMQFYYDENPSKFPADNVFVTPSNLIPTYKTLIELESGKHLTIETASMYKAEDYL